GIIAGLILTLISIVIGITLPMPILITIAISTMFFAVVGHARFLSATLTMGLALIFTYIVQTTGFTIPYFHNAFQSIDSIYLISGLILIGLLTITEGFLMLKNGLNDVSPKLRQSKRGLTVGAL